MKARNWSHLSIVVLLAWAATTIPANTQSSNDADLENNFREDFLIFDEVDELTTGAVRKREEVFKYCLNVSDQAAEARSAVLMKRLKDIRVTLILLMI